MRSELVDLLKPRQQFLVLVLRCEDAVVAEQLIAYLLMPIRIHVYWDCTVQVLGCIIV